ncbi:MAG: hypothetical protein U1E28_04275 [Beijerinckiaceae bacterium]
MSAYRHTQTGWTMRLLAVGAAPLVVLLDRTGEMRHNTPLLVVFAAVSILGLLFSSLTIEVDAEEVRWFFGPGVWRKSIARSEIASAIPVVNPWWSGYGIRFMSRGWLYNVGGRDAVEIMTKDGRMVRLGTDEPQSLARALNAER